DVLILQPFGVRLGVDEKLVELLRDVDASRFAARTAHAGPTIKLPLDLSDDNVCRPIELIQQTRHKTIFLLTQRQKQVQPVHLLMTAFHRDRLSVVNGFLGFLGQTIGVHGSSGNLQYRITNVEGTTNDECPMTTFKCSSFDIRHSSFLLTPVWG